MNALTDLARPAVKTLLKTDEAQLYAEIGIRLKAIESDPGKSSSFAPDVAYDATSMGALDDLQDLGKRHLKKLHTSIHLLVSEAQNGNVEEHQKMAEAYGKGKAEVAAVLAGLMVAKIGLAPAIAAVVASIFTKLFFIKLFFGNVPDAMHRA
jgi:hypothetical protein